MTEKQESMGIVRLEVSNVQRLRLVKIEPDGALVKVTGRNEAGKSSTLDSIEMGLGGRGKLSKRPVRRGAEKGTIRLTLGVARLNPDGTPVYEEGKGKKRKLVYDPKYLIIKNIKPSGADTLKITTPDETMSYEKKKQTLLSSFLSDFTFDPMAFAKADPKRQKEMVLKVSKISIDFEHLSKAAGMDVPELPAEIGVDPTEYFDSVKKRLLSIKRDADREHTRINGVLVELKKEIPEGYENAEAVNIQALLEKRGIEETKKDSKAQVRLELETFQNEYRAAKRRVEDGEQELEDLAEQIRLLQIDFEKKKKEVETNTATLAEMKIEGKKKREQFEEMPDPAFDEIDAALKDAEINNAAAEKLSAMRRHKKELEAHATNITDLDGRLLAVEEYRKHLYTSSEFPVEGISFNEAGELTFEDIPIEQRGDSRQLIIGCHVCAAANPLLRIILIRAGNDIDEDNLAALAEWAEAHQFQIWIEQIATGPEEGAFYIEDGTTEIQGELFEGEEGADDRADAKPSD